MATTGSCLCGAVKYEVSGDPVFTGFCHCGRCRRWSGAAAEPAMGMPSDGVKVTQGQDNISRFEREGWASREFCKTCGSSLFSHPAMPTPVTVVSMGTLDGDPGVKPMMHINVANMAPWDVITDDLVQFQEMPS